MPFIDIRFSDENVMVLLYYADQSVDKVKDILMFLCQFMTGLVILKMT
jgi:hypothetical protein